ncbi:MAG: DUF3040 domain-containing protein [Cellulomonadaceae bacterium]
MPLSEYEQRVLEQMERQLSTDDPRLANTFQPSSSRAGLRYLAAGVGVVVGLALLILGVAQSLVLVGVLGFAVMFGGVLVAFSKPRSKPQQGPIGTVGPDGRVGGPAKKRSRPSTGRQDFMRRLEDRWDRRRDEGL